MSAESSTTSRPRPREEVADGLDALRDVLFQRGWEARLRCYSVCGELDVRLELHRTGGPSVELLGPWAGEACGDSWQAVRLTTGRRVVWCGPSRSCGTTQLMEFVQDLLILDNWQLAGRYLRLG